jgi:hypothetical protein
MWKESFNWTNIPLYLHTLVCHYNQKRIQYGGVKKFSQEGTESHHLLQKQIQERLTSHGGGRGEKSCMENVMMCEYRIILLSKNIITVDEKFVSSHL